MSDLATIATWGRKEVLHVVVEAPRGCGTKITYDEKLGVFTYGRPLCLGLAYPFDWGFVPSTRGEDGDPLDALVVTDVGSFPGVIIPCRLLGVVQLAQDAKSGKGRERNDRLIAVPVEADRYEDYKDAKDLPSRLVQEIEQFFLSTTFFKPKHAEIISWKGTRTAEKLVRRGEKAFRATIR
jgi:inorganic pyrophosphatase